LQGELFGFLSALIRGANYREASRARSDSEFMAKIELCAQEADETQYWLELPHDDCGETSETLDEVWNEADGLIRIFVTMAKNSKIKTKPEG